MSTKLTVQNVLQTPREVADELLAGIDGPTEVRDHLKRVFHAILVTAQTTENRTENVTAIAIARYLTAVFHEVKPVKATRAA